MHVTVKPNEKPMTVILQTETLEWLAQRAAANSRAKCREAATIIEAERHREARLTSPGALAAQSDLRAMEIDAARRIGGAQ